MAEKGRLLTGARARFSIEGVKVGFATGVSIGEEIEYQPAEVLDNIRVEEFVPVAYRVQNFTADRLRIVNETLKSLGLFPSVGANSEEHLQNILNSGDLSATIEDNRTGELIATVEQVKISAKSINVQARGIVAENITFVATVVKDESET